MVWNNMDSYIIILKFIPAWPEFWLKHNGFIQIYFEISPCVTKIPLETTRIHVKLNWNFSLWKWILNIAATLWHQPASCVVWSAAVQSAHHSSCHKAARTTLCSQEHTIFGQRCTSPAVTSSLHSPSRSIENDDPTLIWRNSAKYGIGN